MRSRHTYYIGGNFATYDSLMCCLSNENYMIKQMCIMCLFNHMILIWKESFPDHMIINMWIVWNKIHLILIWLLYEVSCLYTIEFFRKSWDDYNIHAEMIFFAKDFAHQYEIQGCFKYDVWNGRGMFQRSHACYRAMITYHFSQIDFK